MDMARRKIITRENIIGSVFKELEKLPGKYVYTVKVFKSMGDADLISGGRKLLLTVHIFDTERENWQKQQYIGKYEFDDMEDYRFQMTFDNLRRYVKKLSGGE